MNKWVIVTNIEGEPSEVFDDYDTAKQMYEGPIDSFKSFGRPLGLPGPEEVNVYLAEVEDSKSFEN